MLKKIAALTVVVTIVSLSNTARADGWATPRLGGGYTYNYNSGGMPGFSTPRLGGGSNYNFGNTTGFSTPRLGGGWNWFSR